MNKRWATFALAGLMHDGNSGGSRSGAGAGAELSEQQRLRAAEPRRPADARRRAAALARAPRIRSTSAPRSPTRCWRIPRRTTGSRGAARTTAWASRRSRAIDKENVDELQLAWSLALPAGPNAATPLVHDGVIYVHSYGDHVQALDAATGDELWHYARQLPNEFRPDREAQSRALRRQDLLRHVRRARRRAEREDRRRRVGSADHRSRTAASA